MIYLSVNLTYPPESELPIFRILMVLLGCCACANMGARPPSAPAEIRKILSDDLLFGNEQIQQGVKISDFYFYHKMS